MKRRIKIVSNMFIASAAALALVIGFSLGAVSDLSRNIIDRIFPVTYNVEFINGQQDMLSDARIVFNGSTASVSAASFKGTIDMNDAIFSCTDENLRSQNTVRQGLLTALIIATAFVFSASLAWFGVEVRSLASHKAKRRIASAANRRTAAVNYSHGSAANAA